MSREELVRILENPEEVARLKGSPIDFERLFKLATACVKHPDFPAASCPTCLAVAGEAMTPCGPLHEVLELFREKGLLGVQVKIFGRAPGEVHTESVDHAPPLKLFVKLGATILGGALLIQSGWHIYQILLGRRAEEPQPKRGRPAK